MNIKCLIGLHEWQVREYDFQEWCQQCTRCRKQRRTHDGTAANAQNVAAPATKGTSGMAASARNVVRPATKSTPGTAASAQNVAPPATKSTTGTAANAQNVALPATKSMTGVQPLRTLRAGKPAGQILINGMATTHVSSARGWTSV